MEKNVRKSKGEVREKEQEIAQLKTAKDQLSKTIDELQEAIKKRESDSSNVAKNLSVMQAVSQASVDKLTKLESDLNSKSDEISSLKKALEGSWTESNESKRFIGHHLVLLENYL